MKGFHPWQKRFFMLNVEEKRLDYYTSKGSVLIRGSIAIENIQDICWYLDKKQGRRFDLKTSDKNYALMSSIPQEAEDWTQILAYHSSKQSGDNIFLEEFEYDSNEEMSCSFPHNNGNETKWIGSMTSRFHFQSGYLQGAMMSSS